MINDPDFQQRTQMSQEVRESAALAALAWSVGTPDERKVIARDLEPLAARFGDHTHLRLINHYGRPAKIVFDENVVVGPKKESIADLDTDHIAAPTSQDDQYHIQRSNWRANTLRQQEALAYLGFYSGPVDGIPGPKTDSAIRAFQSKNNLTITGHLESDDTAALFQQFTEHRISALNQSAPDAVVFSISFTPQSEQGRYTLSTGASGQTVTTDDVQVILSAINGGLTSGGAKNVYVDLAGFPRNRAEGLMLSLKNRQRALDDTVAIKGMYRSDGYVAIQNLVFEKGIKLETQTLSPEQVTEGENKGWFRSTIDFSIKTASGLKQVTVEFLSRSAEIAQQFFAALTSLLTSNDFDQAHTIAGLLAATDRKVRSLHPELGSDSFKTRLRSQSAMVEVADLDANQSV